MTRSTAAGAAGVLLVLLGSTACGSAPASLPQLPVDPAPTWSPAPELKIFASPGEGDVEVPQPPREQEASPTPAPPQVTSPPAQVGRTDEVTAPAAAGGSPVVQTITTMAPAAPAPAPDSTSPTTPAVVHGSGDVLVSWTEGGQAIADEPHPFSCDYFPSSYEVHVADGAGAVLALATSGPATRVSSQNFSNEIIEWTCKWSYSFTVPALPVYEVSLWAIGEETERTSRVVSSFATGGPTLAGADCFGMPNGSPCFPPTG